ncbi:MAG: methyltransferase domain-containing protein [Eggerthellaceae bacterium]|nr:methyltransferase domain-containing protein [Eggerthellaceae bacterium]
MGPNTLKLTEELLGIVDGVARSTSGDIAGGNSGGVTRRNACGVARSTTYDVTGSTASDAAGRNSVDTAARTACDVTAGNADNASAGIPSGSVVLDLGSGTDISSAMLAREYGFVTFAADLWSDPSDNMRFFESLGLTNRQVIPLKADATALPFASGFFDAALSIDSYNYFGRDPDFLDTCLLPCVKPGGLLAFAIPGMRQDCHDALPACLLRSWTPELLDYMHDMRWWEAIFAKARGAELLHLGEMSCAAEAWADWLECDNPYARGDRAAIEAGGLDYLNIIAVVLRKK